MRSHDLDGDRRLDMQRELIVVARRPELDIVPALADAAELVGKPTLVDLAERVCDVVHVGEKSLVPLDAIPAEDHASVALFEEIRLAARTHKGRCPRAFAECIHALAHLVVALAGRSYLHFASVSHVRDPFWWCCMRRGGCQPTQGWQRKGRLLAGSDPAGVRVDVVVAVPGIVAVVFVAVHEGSAHKPPGRIVSAEADDLEEFVSGFVLAHPDLIAQADLGRGDLGRIEEVAEPQALGHRLVEGVEHLVELVPVFLFGGLEGAHPDGVPVRVVLRSQVVGDTPALDYVDAVVSGIHLPVRGVVTDAEGQGAAEEVPHHLAHARPAVAVLARGTVALKLAVLEKRFDGIPTAVPVQVQPDLSLLRGDDCPISHDDLLIFRRSPCATAS